MYKMLIQCSNMKKIFILQLFEMHLFLMRIFQILVQIFSIFSLLDHLIFGANSGYAESRTLFNKNSCPKVWIYFVLEKIRISWEIRSFFNCNTWLVWYAIYLFAIKRNWQHIDQIVFDCVTSAVRRVQWIFWTISHVFEFYRFNNVNPMLTSNTHWNFLRSICETLHRAVSSSRIK